MATTIQNADGLTADSISRRQIWKVIGAASVGTMIEWYDFYIFGSLPPHDLKFSRLNKFCAAHDAEFEKYFVIIF